METQDASPTLLSRATEAVGLSGPLTEVRAGVLYLTSPTDYSVKRLTDGGVKTVLTDRRLRWPDTFSEGSDGTMFLTASHIQDTQWFKPGAPPSIKTQLFSFPPIQ